MASTYSANLAIELIGTGEQSGTWGTTTNTNLGTLIEQSISGYVTQAITDGSGANTTITIPNGTTGVARNMFIEMTGALTFSTTSLIVPANKKMYFIFNNTSGGFAVTVKVSGQTGVLVPNGKKVILTSNGTDIVEAANQVVGAFGVGGALTVTGAATVGTTLGVTGTSTMAAINASGQLSTQIVGMTNPIKIGVLSDNSAIGAISLTTNLASTTLVGMYGGADSNLNVNVPTGGFIAQRVNNVEVTKTASTGLSVTGTLGVTGAVTTQARFTSSTSAGSTAWGATGGELVANATYGAIVSGYGTTADVALINRAGNPALEVTANTQNLIARGTLGVTGASTLTGNVSFRTMTSTNLIAHPLITLDTSGTGQNLTLDVNDSGSLARVGPNSNTQLDIITANTARITIAGTGAVSIPGQLAVGGTGLNNSAFAVNGTGQTYFATFSDFTTTTLTIAGSGGVITLTPTTSISVAGALGVTGIISTGTASVVNAATSEIVLPNNLYLRGATAANTNTIPLIKVNSSNGITIGTVSGADVVTTSGQFRTEYAWANTGGTTTVMVDSNGSLFKLASARKYKMDFAPYSKGLADVLKLDPQYYRIKSQGEDSHIYAGLIADDLDAQGLSEFVAYGPEGVDSINYGHMAALFANAIKELSADFQSYKSSHP